MGRRLCEGTKLTTFGNDIGHRKGIEGSQTEMFALAAKKWHMSEDNPKNQDKDKKRKHDDPDKKKKKHKKKEHSP